MKTQLYFIPGLRRYYYNYSRKATPPNSGWRALWGNGVGVEPGPTIVRLEASTVDATCLPEAKETSPNGARAS